MPRRRGAHPPHLQLWGDAADPRLPFAEGWWWIQLAGCCQKPGAGELRKKRGKKNKNEKKKKSHSRKHIIGMSLSLLAPPAGCAGAAGVAPAAPMCLPPPQPWVLLCAKPLALLGTAGGWWGGFGGSRARCSPSPFDKAKRPLPSLCKFCTVPESESLVSWGKK